MIKLFILFTLLCFGLMAQAQPQKVNYQAVAVNASGVTVKNRVISLKLSILDSSSTGSVLYSETHQPTTDGSGQFSVYLGGGTAVSGTFSNIPWGNTKDKFLKAEADFNGGTNYVLMGVSQVVSVPYALAAGSLSEGATITGANGSQYTLTVGANGPVWSLTNPNVNFSCGQTVSYAGENYPTVQIGTQCWFQKNLNVGTMIQGANDQTNNSIIEKYCYNNDTANCSIYGGLYQWAEAVQYLNGASNTTSLPTPFIGNVRGVCPAGWNISEESDWNNLELFLGGSMVAGGSLKAFNNLWNSPNSGATNSSGFSALPSGRREGNGMFDYLGNFTYYFNSTEINLWQANLRAVIYSNATIYKFFNLAKSYGFSVRCLKD